MNKQWRLVFTWPNLVLIEIDGPGVVSIVPDNAMLALLSHLQEGDIIQYGHHAQASCAALGGVPGRTVECALPVGHTGIHRRGQITWER